MVKVPQPWGIVAVENNDIGRDGMLNYSQDQVEHAFSPGQFVVGRSYQRGGRVLKVEIAPDGGLRGTGSVPRPYDVSIVINVLNSGARTRVPLSYRFMGICSCPVHYNCKHVIAVLLHGLEMAARQRDTPPHLRTTASVVAAEVPAGPEAELARWLTAVEAAAGAADPEAFPADVRYRLLYRLSLKVSDKGVSQLVVEAVSVQLRKNGTLTYQNKGIDAHRLVATPSSAAGYLRDSDLFILRSLGSAAGPYHYSTTYPLNDSQGPLLLERMVRTGRAHWGAVDGPALALGPVVVATPRWQADDQGAQRLCLETGDGISRQILPMSTLWYLDHASHQCGPVETGLPAKLLIALLAAPPVVPAMAGWLGQELEKRLPDRPNLRPRAFGASVERVVEPVPCLRLSLIGGNDDDDDCEDYDGIDRYPNEEDIDDGVWPEAQLSFYYIGREVGAFETKLEFHQVDGTNLVVVKRQWAAEQVALNRLKELGFVQNTGKETFSFFDLSSDYKARPGLLTPFLRFVHHDAPVLRAEGWKIEVENGFPEVLADPDEDWAAEIGESSGIDWFGISLGVTVAGEKLDLIPLLLPILRALPSDGGLELLDRLSACDGGTFYVPVGEGRVLPLPVERVRPLLLALYDLFRVGGIADDGSIRLNPARLAELAELEAAASATRLRWVGGSQLLELGRRLRDGAGVTPTLVPAGLTATLRSYQQHGLDWLQFLRETGFGGVLADDMGLGKTVQALAHILAEKEAGRLDRPCLVIAPTSLMVNWRLEAARFASVLSVLVLHGTGRRGDFERIADYDLVLTTYPLLTRDKAVLLEQQWHVVILDEAQAIKNPKAQATLAAVQLRARHRLCLTGTPMENNLEELWSLFHFLAPGVLGDLSQFKRVFRNPIEKGGDRDRQRLLARRVKPFLLRRTKGEVATELPEKTEIIEHIELEGAQRDLYESIRVAMDARVRAEIAAKGLARSHIAILDALLKLRQVCCDPRLVKLASAKAVTSAKLNRLTEMLPELIADGRRILLFSQFTSMLTLIEAELVRLRIDFVKLTGQTRDRATPVERFQAGEVPVFLISLKAGGVGLNLTAADTVILYDPWWNPAVERQAMDRAHRIGQDKAVFVYRLATVGTVEEAMLSLQARKQALADGLFDPDTDLGGALSADDLDLLFRPLERI
ncbi:Helicase [uncultured Gammaproteobacteria bacterium]